MWKGRIMIDLEYKRMLLAAVLMSVVMSAVLSFYWTLSNISINEQTLNFESILLMWGGAWFNSFLIACPASLFFAPIIKHFVSRIITEGY